jgi:hypothetical protein
MRITFVFVTLLTTPALANGFKLEYLDFLSPEIVGELQPRTYDFQLNDKFVGVARMRPNPLVAGGFGLRLVGREPSGNSNGGVRFSVESSGEWGRFQDSPFGTVSRAELLGGIGYEGTLGILVLHTATIFGFDYQSFDIGKGANLSTFSLRAGQQVGVHLQVASCLFLYADGTVDWDGQWRVRAGISVGELIRKPKSTPESKAVLAPNAPARSIVR